MVKKYKMLRVPVEAVRGFKVKQAKMERNIKTWTGKVVKIPLTRVMVAVANSPSEIHEGKIIGFTKKRVRRVEK